MFGRQEIPDEQRGNLSLTPDDEHLGLAFGARYQAWTPELDEQLAADWQATHPTLRYDFACSPATATNTPRDDIRYSVE